MNQPNIITGMFFPSAGVRVLIPLGIAAFMSRASGESVNDLSDFNLGSSIGGMAATGYAMSDRFTSAPLFDPVDVFYDTFVTAHKMFAHHPEKTVIRNSALDAIDLLRTHLAPLRQYRYSGADFVLRRAQNWLKRGASHYDSSILQRSLYESFGNLQMSDCTKTNLVNAISLKTRRKAIFGKIDERMFPSEGLSGHYFSHASPGSAPADKFPVYDRVGVTDALMGATAIPGLIRYHRIEDLKQSFMDTGSWGDGMIRNAMDELEMRANNRLRLEREAIAKNKRWTLNLRKRAADEAPVVMRLVVMGVGNEGALKFDETGASGLIKESPNALRASGSGASDDAFIPLRSKYNAMARNRIGVDGVAEIDGIMRIASTDIKDGRLENLLNNVRESRHIAIKHRKLITSEITLRVKTLQARGLRTPEQVEQVARNLSRIETAEGAARVFDSFAIHAGNVERILRGHAEDKPAEITQTGWRMPAPPLPSPVV